MKLPILKMMNSLSCTCGIATIPSGSTVTKMYIPPWVDHETSNQLNNYTTMYPKRLVN